MKRAFCAILAVVVVSSSVVFSAFAISETKQKSIMENCDKIKTNITNLQHTDSRARVYLGRYYERILNSFIVPLNMRLVENNLSNPELIELQADFAAGRQDFIDDYIKYQQGLEGLAAANCKDEPDKFYEQLIQVKAMQKNVSNDALRLKNYLNKHVELVKKIRETIK